MPDPAPRRLPTSAELQRQDDETEALRRAVDELRQALDVAPPAPVPVRRPWWRRRSRALLVAAGVVLALVLGALVTGAVVRGRDGATPAVAAGSDTGAPGGAPVAPLQAPEGTVPATGPGVDVAGTTVVALPVDGGFLVVEQRLLPPTPPDRLELALPDVRRLGGEVAALRPTVSDLRVAVDGAPVAVTTAGPGRWSVPAAGARLVRASYRIDASLLVSTPSPDGRALGLVTPLLGSALPGLQAPLVVRVVGARVQGLTCPDAPAALLLCGTRAGTTWTAAVPASVSPVVVVQLDLGSP